MATSTVAGNYEAMYKPIADFAAQKYGIPQGMFARLIASESSWNPNAVGAALPDGTRAKGIAQFVPGTARQYGVDTVDVTSSLMGAAAYLKDLYTRKGSWTEALYTYKGATSEAGRARMSPIVADIVSGKAYEGQLGAIDKAAVPAQGGVTIGSYEPPKDTGTTGTGPGWTDGPAAWWEWIKETWKKAAIGSVVFIVGLLLIVFTIYIAVTRGRNAAVKAVPELANLRK